MRKSAKKFHSGKAVLLISLGLVALAAAPLLSSCGGTSEQAATLTGIELMFPSDKTDYVVGDLFDPTGVVITGT